MPSVFYVVILISFLYFIRLAIYRLYFSPIAHIPGPRLAAISFWPEFYWDVVKRGRYQFRIVELHKKYGPIIRINPYEVHVADSTFYDTVYLSSGHKIDKWYFAVRFFSNPEAMIATLSHDHHRIRRGALGALFSKQGIRRIEPLIYENVDLMMEQVRLAKEAGSVLNVTYLLLALAMDVITTFEFSDKFGFLQDLSKAEDWHTLVINFLGMGALFKQFPLAAWLVKRIPAWLSELMDRRLKLLAGFFELLEVRTKAIMSEGNTFTDIPPTLVHAILYGTLPDKETTLERVLEEAQSLTGAGSVTTAEIISSMLFYLLKNHDSLRKLQAELGPIMKRTDGRPELRDLEVLPYLTAVIKEGLRLGLGNCQRLPRIHEIDLHFEDYIIPKGTPISMSALLVHKDPLFFPDPDAFVPERWLDGTRLDQFLVAFSKGPRQCLGIYLAWAEMYLALAALVGSGFEYELFETGYEDVEIVHDFVVPFPKLDSKRVRVQVQ